MAVDEDGVRKPSSDLRIGEDLDALSIEELEERIMMLESEIGRYRQAIDRKQDTKSSAEAFFRK